MTATAMRRGARTETATVTVTSVALRWAPDFDLVRLSCSHAFFLEHDETNASLVGAETKCEGC